MSLILGVFKGEKIFLNEVVMDILSTSEDMDSIDISIADTKYTLNNHSFLEVYPDVFAAVGKSRHTSSDTLTRIAIDAPRSMKILRSSNKNHARNSH